jgi:hypothetical protein
VEEAGDFVEEALTGEFGIEDHAGGAGAGKRLGISLLMVVGGKGEGDEEGGFASGGKLGDGGGAGAGDDEIGLGKGGGHVVDEGFDASGKPGGGEIAGQGFGGGRT